MYAFHPAPGGYLSVVSADERSILIRLVLDVAALIADEDEAPPRPEPPMASDDPIAHLDFDVAEPDEDHLDLDPALERVFPPMSVSDPELAQELRGLTLPDLRRTKIANLWMVVESLQNGEDGVHVAEDQTRGWRSALTDLRLVLASRLNIDDDESAEKVYELAVRAGDSTPAETDDDDMQLALASLYSGVTWWQESLLSAMSPREDGA